MVISGGQAVFAVVAKDAASKPLKNVGKSFGTLKRNGVTAFKAVAGAAVVAAGAIAAFTADAIKGAIEDERSTILLTAALKARGFEMDKLAPKIDEQILAMQRLGFTDDDVRSGLEVGSRFFKNQNNLLKANATAANIAAATGISLSDAMMAIGKGARGNTKGLKSLGIEVEKGAKTKDILRAADEKYLGIAEELANSTSGKILAAQIALGEEMDKFGAQFIPAVTDALRFVTKEVFPAFKRILEKVGPVISDLWETKIKPLAKSVGDLFAAFDGADFSLLDLAFAPILITLDALKVLIDAITAGIKFIQGTPAQKVAFAAASVSASSGTTFGLGSTTGGGGPMTGGTSSYLQTSVNFSIGTQNQDKLVSESLIRQGSGRRTSYGP